MSLLKCANRIQAQTIVPGLAPQNAAIIQIHTDTLVSVAKTHTKCDLLSASVDAIQVVSHRSSDGNHELAQALHIL